MKAKINYLSKWNAEGTHYNQTVTLSLTTEQIAAVNRLTTKIWYAPYCDHCGTSVTIGYGINYVTLSAARIIAEYTGIDSDRRYKNNRNTVFNIIAA